MDKEHPQTPGSILHRDAMANGVETGVRVSSLFIYPVKSCKGISVSEATVTPTGFMWDRQWMVVNSESGRFLTQRQEPRLALIHQSLPPQALSPSSWEHSPPDLSLALSAPGMGPLHLPLALEAYSALPTRRVAVWQWSGEALDAGPEAAAWFSEFLGRDLRVVRFNTGKAYRPTAEDFAPGFQHAFSDSFPILMISQASLESLNSRLHTPLPMDRFRPNVVVAGCSPFEEDTWRAFMVGGVGRTEFRGVKPASRCKVTTVNQETAEVGTEPLKVLREFRSGKVLELPRPFGKAEVFFGAMLVCHFKESDTQQSTAGSRGDSSVRVGDVIHVLQSA